VVLAFITFDPGCAQVTLTSADETVIDPLAIDTMPEVQKASGAQDPGEAGARDRRRAGRSEVNPTLLPLLRNAAGQPAGSAPLAPPEELDIALALREMDDTSDSLAPARGIAMGLAISVVLWAGITLVALVILR